MKRRQVSDRVFFSQSPARRFRIRPPFPGEVEFFMLDVPAGSLASVIVQQLAPGVRNRFAFVHISPVPESARHSDEAIAFIAAAVRECVK